MTHRRRQKRRREQENTFNIKNTRKIAEIGKIVVCVSCDLVILYIFKKKKKKKFEIKKGPMRFGWPVCHRPATRWEPKHSQKQSKTNSTQTNLDSNQGLLLVPQPLRTASRSTKLLTALQGFKLNLTLLLRSLLLSCEENYLWTIVTMSTGPSLHMSGLRERSLSFLL